MIDKYKKGALSEAEMEQVEETLLKKLWDNAEDTKIRASLRQILANEALTENEAAPSITLHKPQLKVVHRFRWIAGAAAATILFVVGAAWWFFAAPNTSRLNATGLALHYLKTEAAPSLNNVMDDAEVAALEQAAREAYNKGDFALAAQSFAKIPPTTPAHFFYLGIALMKQSPANYPGAINSLLQARKLGKGWQEDALNWHLALAYLAQNDRTLAKEELNRIVQMGRDNVRKASELMNKLK
jgi:hypothetical protein